MLEAILWSVFMCLIIFGTVAFCYAIMLKLLLPKHSEDYYIFIPCDSNSKNVRQKAYGMRLKVNLIGDDKNCKVVILDCGIDDAERDDVMKICRECNGIYLVPNEYIKEFINGRF